MSDRSSFDQNESSRARERISLFGKKRKIFRESKEEKLENEAARMVTKVAYDQPDFSFKQTADLPMSRPVSPDKNFKLQFQFS